MAEDLGFSLNFLKIRVRDLAAMRGFYAAALGFEERQLLEGPNFQESLLSIPGEAQTLVLLHYSDRAPPFAGSQATIGFTTRDIGAARARLLASGATAQGEIVAVGNVRACFVGDPEGNEVELIQFVGA
jgi:catechol 2,3-dioxygenase-like lactoylglutathione lyase family enzyme